MLFLEPLPDQGIPPNRLPTNNPSDPTSSTMHMQPLDTYRNTKLEKLIAKCDYHSPINLERQSLTDRDMPTIVQRALLEKQCTTLRLSNNRIKSEGAAILAQALHGNPKLEGLYIFDNDLSDKGAILLAQALAVNNFTLKALSLGHNGITDEGVGHLAEMLKTNETLIDLWLPWNRISDSGVRRLADVLMHHNRTLKRLSLDMNKLVSDSSVDVLIDAINQNPSLTAIGVSDCNLSKPGKARLREAAKLKHDIELNTDL